MLSTLALTVLSCTPVHFVAPDTPQALEQIERLFPDACPIVATVSGADASSEAVEVGDAKQEPTEGGSYLFLTPLLDPPEPVAPSPSLRPQLPATPVRRAAAAPANANDWLTAPRRPAPRAS